MQAHPSTARFRESDLRKCRTATQSALHGHAFALSQKCSTRNLSTLARASTTIPPRFITGSIPQTPKP
eukprot:1928435-Amphidinium_carterae.1